MLKRDKVIKEVMRSMSFATSHHIAKRCECTPSYVRKVCWELFKQGRAAYREDYHQGGAGIARVFVSINYARAYNSQCQYDSGKYILPPCIQEEMAI